MKFSRISLALATGVLALSGCTSVPSPMTYEDALSETPQPWINLLARAKKQKSYVMGNCDKGTTVISVRESHTFRVVTATTSDGTELHWVKSSLPDFYVVEQAGKLVSFTDKEAFQLAMMRHAPMYSTSWTSNRAADCNRTDGPTQ